MLVTENDQQCLPRPLFKFLAASDTQKNKTIKLILLGGGGAMGILMVFRRSKLTVWKNLHGKQIDAALSVDEVYWNNFVSVYFAFIFIRTE